LILEGKRATNVMISRSINRYSLARDPETLKRAF
jgi:hypothetical protein